jgi:hypothetical protein
LSRKVEKNSGALNTAVPYLSRGLFLALFGDFLFLLAANLMLFSCSAGYHYAVLRFLKQERRPRSRLLTTEKSGGEKCRLPTFGLLSPVNAGNRHRQIRLFVAAWLR